MSGRTHPAILDGQFFPSNKRDTNSEFLSLAEVVRYDTDGERNRYRLKQPCEVRDVRSALCRFVQTTQPSGARRIR
jgi:hypothetical protein